MAAELNGVRAQILANAKILLKPTAKFSEPFAGSQSTLTVPLNPYEGLEVVVFGAPGEHVAALMVGLKPTIESDKAPTPEGAVRKLLMATCEMLKEYIPKVLPHQRNIHGGGVFDEDMISTELMEAQRRMS